MDLGTIYRIEKEILERQLAGVRAAVEHAGEKGSALESYAMKFFRDALPAEFGLTTGFIAFPPDTAYGEPTLSKQIDIIIYDALHGSPLVRLPTCDVMPLEAVLGYVEVKAKLTNGKSKNSIRQCVADAQEIRRHTNRWYWVGRGANATTWHLVPWASVRSYVFAYEGPPNAAQELSLASSDLKEHAELSALYINSRGHFESAPTARPKVNTVAVGDDALLTFRHALISGLARMRWSPGMLIPDSSGKPHPTTTAFLDHYFPERLKIWKAKQGTISR